jgi:hypothetical protein
MRDLLLCAKHLFGAAITSSRRRADAIAFGVVEVGGVAGAADRFGHHATKVE